MVTLVIHLDSATVLYLVALAALLVFLGLIGLVLTFRGQQKVCLVCDGKGEVGKGDAWHICEDCHGTGCWE